MSKWKVPFVDLSREYQDLEYEIMGKIKEILYSGRFVLGSELLEFETRMADYLGVKDVVGVNSGTDALFLCLKQQDIGLNHEVITVAHTHISTISSIFHCGATPVLVDIGEDYNIDVSKIEVKITDRTRAIIPVHLNGKCCDMDVILKLCATYGLVCIEDTCQSLGTTYKGKKAGSYGLGCFSTHPLKTLSAAGDGGFIACDDYLVAEEFRQLRDHCLLSDKVTYNGFGYNSRLDEIQAAILNIKMDRLDEWISRRREIARKYSGGLVVLETILPTYSEEHTFNSYVIKVKERDKLEKFLTKQGIETQVHWKGPLHKQLFQDVSLPVTEDVSDTSISLPIYPYLTNEEIDYVIDSIWEFFGSHG